MTDFSDPHEDPMRFVSGGYLTDYAMHKLPVSIEGAWPKSCCSCRQASLITTGRDPFISVPSRCYTLVPSAHAVRTPLGPRGSGPNSVSTTCSSSTSHYCHCQASLSFTVGQRAWESIKVFLIKADEQLACPAIEKLLRPW